MMKVAVSSTGKGLDSLIDPRFGRCACFVVVDTNDMSVVSYDNESAALGGGAGIQAAQFVLSKGAEAVLTGNCGPNALAVFSAAGVGVYPGQGGTVKEALERFHAGDVPAAMVSDATANYGKTTAPAGPAMSAPAWIGRCRGGAVFGRGMGGGAGLGMGRGMGMRQGGGRGGGRWVAGPRGDMPVSYPAPETAESLKRQAEELHRQLQTIQERINRIS